jgi:O-antigen/teichoic acid export membrane protein
VFAAGARVYAVAAMAVTLALTARWLGPAGRGLVATVVTWSTLIGTLAHLSLGQVALEALAGRADDVARAAAARRALVAACVVVGRVVGLGLLGGRLAVGADWLDGIPPWALVAVGALVPLYVWEQYGSYLLIARGRLRVYNLAQVAGRTLEMAVVAVLVGVMKVGPTGAIVGAVIAQLTISSATFLVARPAAAPLPGSVRPMLRSYLVRGIQLHPTAIGYVLFSSADILLVRHYRGAGATGIYQMATQLANVLVIVPAAASQVLFSQVGVLGAERAWQATRRLTAWTLLGVVGLAAIGYAMAPIPVLVVGEPFRPVIPVFRLLLVSVLLRTFPTLMNPQWIGRGLFGQSAAVALLVGLTSVVGDVLLIPRYGVIGAAVASIAGGAVCLAFSVALAYRIETRPAAPAAGTGAGGPSLPIAGPAATVPTAQV